MIRFIDLGKQIAVDETDEDYPREFAFYNTIDDSFFRFNQSSTWTSFSEFALDFKGSQLLLERFKSLCPDWVPK
jgi:hypothetical protein